MNMTVDFNSLLIDLKFNVLDFLNYKDVIKLRTVNKTFKQIGDNKKFFPPIVFKLKEIFSKLTEVAIQIEKYDNLLKCKESKINELVNLNNNLFGYSVSCIYCFPSTISNLFSDTFPSIKESIKINQDLYASIEVINTLTKDFDLVTLQRQHADLSQAFQNQKLLLRLVESQNELKRKKQAVFDTMKSLFGGQEEYETLPILDIGDREGFTGLIDFIKPEEMSAPIMRGRDKLGRNFFTIRFKDEGEKLKCQTFFERFAKQDAWFDAGDRFVKYEGYLIELGQIKLKPFEELAAAIKAKHNGDKVII
ncbi:MAG: F-box protein [Candidatus Protochlamydia sp.]|nr:F-box protein [Candidatus Protochlamydia sp.]